MTEGYSPVIPKREDGPSRPPVEFTAVEQDRVSQLLERKLGKEELSTRAGPRGSSLTYVESHKAIELANYIFNYNGWCSQVQNITVDFVDEARDRCTVGLSVLMRITLKDGTFHEDIGYGSAQMPDKSGALEKAKKEAVSDARKRTLRLFGSALGNCVYDKQYVKDIRSGQAVSERIIPTHTPTPKRPAPVVKSEPSTPLPVPIFSPQTPSPQTPSSLSAATTTTSEITTPRSIFPPPPYSPPPVNYNPNLQTTSTPGANFELRTPSSASASSSSSNHSTSVSTPRTPKFPARNGSSNVRIGNGSCSSSNGCKSNGSSGGSGSGSSCKSSHSCGRGGSSSGSGSCSSGSGRGRGSGGSGSCNTNVGSGCNSGQKSSSCMGNLVGSSGNSSDFGGHSGTSGTSGVSVSSGNCGSSSSSFNAGNSNFRPQGSCSSSGGGPMARSSGCVGVSGFGTSSSSSSFTGSVGGHSSSNGLSSGNYGVGSSSCNSTSGSMLSNGSSGVNSCGVSGYNHSSSCLNSNSTDNNPLHDGGSSFSSHTGNFDSNHISEADLEAFDFSLLPNNANRGGSGVHFNKENFDPSMPLANRTSNSFGLNSTSGWPTDTSASEGGMKRSAAEPEDFQGQKRGRI